MSQRADTPGQVDRAAQTGGNRLMVLIVGGIVAVIVIALAAGVNPWEALFIDPLINVLILFDNIFFNQFGVAIIAFTLVMRLVTLPLTVRQFQSTKAMQAIQPRMQEIQKKYKDPKRRQEETAKLMREAGVNPLGCIFPMLIQFPIWIALYRALIIMVGGTPESLLSLSQRLYPWSFLNQSVPLQTQFLWLDLGQPDTSFILAILVGISTYVTQKLTTSQATASAQQQQQMQMMNWMMPLLLAWFTLQVPS
ncbi:MAG: YidC/Oxa1 family membrane protein insertase, partial [Dehalococcoidia bacterium]